MHIFQRLINERDLITVNLRRPARAINSFLALLSYKLKLLKPLGKPIVVDIEPTNVCNLRCPHCQVTHWDKAQNRLTMDNFKKWLRHFTLASRIKLQGMGEPFLNKELPAMIKELEKEGIYIKVISNGTVLTGAVHEVLTQTKHLDIRFSFDAADKETFEEIRVGSDFDKIKENLIKIVKTKPRRSKVSACMVAFEEHKEQIKRVIELMATLGVDEFRLQLIVFNFGQNGMDSKTVERRVKPENRSLAVKDELQRFAKGRNLKMIIDDELFDEKNQCPWPWLGTYIDTEGYVIPCCRVANANICNFGNLNKEDFDSIWYSERYQKFRNQIRSNSIPEFCRSCYKAAYVERLADRGNSE